MDFPGPESLRNASARRYWELDRSVTNMEANGEIEGLGFDARMTHCQELLELAKKIGDETEVIRQTFRKIHHAERCISHMMVIKEASGLLKRPLGLYQRLQALSYRKEAHIYYSNKSLHPERLSHLENAVLDSAQYTNTLQAIIARREPGFEEYIAREAFALEEYRELKVRLENPGIAASLGSFIAKIVFNKSS